MLFVWVLMGLLLQLLLVLLLVEVVWVSALLGLVKVQVRNRCPVFLLLPQYNAMAVVVRVAGLLVHTRHCARGRCNSSSRDHSSCQDEEAVIDVHPQRREGAALGFVLVSVRLLQGPFCWTRCMLLIDKKPAAVKLMESGRMGVLVCILALSCYTAIGQRNLGEAKHAPKRRSCTVGKLVVRKAPTKS